MFAVVQFYGSAVLLMLPLLSCVGIGVFWGKRDYPFGGAFVTMLVTSVTTPALVFHTFATTHLDDGALVDIALASLLALLLCAVGCALLLRRLGLPVRQLLPTAFLPNAGNLGLPMSHLAFGDAGLSVAVAFFAVNSFVMHTVGVRLVADTSTRGSWRSPVLIAAVAAVTLRALHVPVPQWVIETCALLGGVTVPLMLISLGHALALIPASGLRTGSMLAAMRLGVGLLAGALVVWLLDLPAELGGSLALQMAMPCAVVSYMYARRYTDQGDAVAGAVLVSTVVFLALAPLALWLARG
ncbi:AEC family transporter [Bordetella sp. 2513F-2]